jgi:hypothetical protein
MHYARKNRLGETGTSNPIKVYSYGDTKCLVVQCDKKSERKNLCQKHYDSQRKSTLTAQKIQDMKDSGCYVCGSFEKLTVDHDHSCCKIGYSCDNCVRGILCHKCNTAAGLLNDDCERIMSLCAYLMSKMDVLQNA